MITTTGRMMRWWAALTMAGLLAAAALGTRRNRQRLLAVVAGLALITAACGDDEISHRSFGAGSTRGLGREATTERPVNDHRRGEA
jgi:hypothetical protein